MDYDNIYQWIYRKLTADRLTPVWHSAAPENSSFPRIIYTVVSATPGDTDLSDYSNLSINIQVDVYAETPEELFAAAKGIRELFDIPSGVISITPELTLASSQLSNITDGVEYGDPDKAGEELIFRRTFEFYIHTN